MSFEEFQDGRQGGHLGYWNGTTLGILNLCVTVNPPIKFQLNRTGLGKMSFEESWISVRNDFRNSESPCCHNAFY